MGIIGKRRVSVFSLELNIVKEDDNPREPWAARAAGS
jgi:hypothetical protein